MKLDYDETCFPPNWIILDNPVFKTTEAGDTADLTGQLLVQTNSKGILGGNFRFSVGGSKQLDIVIAAADILDCGVAHNCDVHIQTQPSTISLRLNALSSNWIDLQEE